MPCCHSLNVLINPEQQSSQVHRTNGVSHIFLPKNYIANILYDFISPHLVPVLVSCLGVIYTRDPGNMSPPLFEKVADCEVFLVVFPIVFPHPASA